MPLINRPLADDALQLSLGEELERLTGEEGIARGARRARTLVKDGPLRATLVMLGPGAHIPSHHAEGPITIQGVAGTVSLRVNEKTHDLGPGDLLAVGAGIEHSVESPAGGAFLLTLAVMNEG